MLSFLEVEGVFFYFIIFSLVMMPKLNQYKGYPATADH